MRFGWASAQAVLPGPYPVQGWVGLVSYPSTVTRQGGLEASASAIFDDCREIFHRKGFPQLPGLHGRSDGLDDGHDVWRPVSISATSRGKHASCQAPVGIPRDYSDRAEGILVKSATSCHSTLGFRGARGTRVGAGFRAAWITAGPTGGLGKGRSVCSTRALGLQLPRRFGGLRGCPRPVSGHDRQRGCSPQPAGISRLRESARSAVSCVPRSSTRPLPRSHPSLGWYERPRAVWWFCSAPCWRRPDATRSGGPTRRVSRHARNFPESLGTDRVRDSALPHLEPFHHPRSGRVLPSQGRRALREGPLSGSGSFHSKEQFFICLRSSAEDGTRNTSWQPLDSAWLKTLFCRPEPIGNRSARRRPTPGAIASLPVPGAIAACHLRPSRRAHFSRGFSAARHEARGLQKGRPT